MSTDVTADDVLRSLTKWGLNWRFYKDKADFLTHNRNGSVNNSRATPGGFGPLRGVAAHNTASTAQSGMLDYLYRGDAARNLPGPLATAGILKTGEVVLLGWGSTNATGPGDPYPDSLVRKNAMPLDREITPTTSGPSDPNAILYAPYYIGFEACYASEGPTTAQYKAMVLFTCAVLDAMGGPSRGYGAGSVVMHRELTTTRSDPQGVGKAQLRRDVAAQFKAGPPGAPEGFLMALTDQQQTDLYNRVMGGIPAGSAIGRKNPDGGAARVLDSADGDYLRQILVGIAGKVGAPVDVDEAAIASGVVEGIKPIVAQAVNDAVASGVPTDKLADAVVSALGSKLAPAGA